ncbi:RICIN domain-containing protein [Plantactinospora veratri]|uniref:RICIN domain-containing protein n=1 Tax=Plantactinospora veratri TaxID=1436122 RepID=A0ABU7SLA3_9ACTN
MRASNRTWRSWSRRSGLCLDVTNAFTANGGLVELWACNGGSNRQWRLGQPPRKATPDRVPSRRHPAHRGRYPLRWGR